MFCNADFNFLSKGCRGLTWNPRHIIILLKGACTVLRRKVCSGGFWYALQIGITQSKPVIRQCSQRIRDLCHYQFSKNSLSWVLHNWLIANLAFAGMEGNLLGWIVSFLIGRTTAMRLVIKLCKQRGPTCGVPCWCVPGPASLLWDIYAAAQNKKAWIWPNRVDLILVSKVRNNL